MTDYRNRVEAGLYDPDPEVREKALAKWNKDEAKAKLEAEKQQIEQAQSESKK